MLGACLGASVEQMSMTLDDRAPTSAHRRSPLRSIVGGSVGNLVEWYDWYVYSAFSLYFAASFFPSDSRTIELMSAAAVFAAGFLMRPVGGWLMGLYADRHGRKTALTLSVLLMSLGSFVIALLPGYEQIGLAAPAILLLVRMLQGLSVGGEYGASATYLSEMAPPHRRGFYSSFQYVTLVGGQLLALGLLLVLQSLLDQQALEAWGWRIPFAIGGALALVALAMRRNLEETQAFAQGDRRGGAIRLLREHPKAVATVVGMTIGGTVAFYTFTTYTQKYLVNSAGWGRDDATLLCAVTLLIFVSLQPIFGHLSDRIGRRPLLLAFGVLGAIAVVPILTALGQTRDPWIGPASTLLLLGAAQVFHRRFVRSKGIGGDRIHRTMALHGLLHEGQSCGHCQS
jgi:MHS family alpha-ketoglutarate permease-like MFS transporter